MAAPWLNRCLACGWHWLAPGWLPDCWDITALLVPETVGKGLQFSAGFRAKVIYKGGIPSFNLDWGRIFCCQADQSLDVLRVLEGWNQFV